MYSRDIQDPCRLEIQCPQCEKMNSLSIKRREDNVFDFYSRYCWSCRSLFPDALLDALLVECLALLFRKTTHAV